MDRISNCALSTLPHRNNVTLYHSHFTEQANCSGFTYFQLESFYCSRTLCVCVCVLLSNSRPQRRGFIKFFIVVIINFRALYSTHRSLRATQNWHQPVRRERRKLFMRQLNVGPRLSWNREQPNGNQTNRLIFTTTDARELLKTRPPRPLFAYTLSPPQQSN